MRKILNKEEMKALDNYSIQNIEGGSLSLMEEAARKVYLYLMDRDPDTVLIVAGNGNNGADGVAVARMLHLSGIKVNLYLTFQGEPKTKELTHQLLLANEAGVSFVNEMEPADFIVDAIFGIGLSRDIEGSLKTIINQMNQLKGEKVAIDIASGVDATTGAICNVAFQADVTITFGFEKWGMLLYPGASYSGKIIVEKIGFLYSYLEQGNYAFTGNDELLEQLPSRKDNSHKGTFGHVLVVAGSDGMAGAAYFAAKSAYRTGAGLVTILTHKANQQVLQIKIPEAIVVSYANEEEAIRKLNNAAMNCNAIVLGPGLGQSKESIALVESCLKINEKPMVIDADGLNIIAKMNWQNRLKPCMIVTPHLKEMARLTKKNVADIQNQTISCAKAFQKEYTSICVLKSARTVVAFDNTFYLNVAGNNGMATGGSGDVLAGVIGGLLAQQMEVGVCAVVGTYLHSKAGDAACEKVGKYSLMASDIIKGIVTVLGGNENE